MVETLQKSEQGYVTVYGLRFMGLNILEKRFRDRLANNEQQIITANFHYFTA
jgi:hypothetical protein